MLPPSRFTESVLAAPSVRPVDATIEVVQAPPRVLLPWTVKICLVIAVAGFGASQYLTWFVGTAGFQRDARMARGLADPETTGSIASAAAGVTLDPCAVSLKLKGAR